jgi:5-methylcytosine-specific restriction endonuclease McrA
MNKKYKGYWYGKKRSLKDREKMRLSHLGEKQTVERILKRIKRGKEHYNWQGGVTPKTRRRTRGMFWKKIADEVRRINKNTCFVCEKYGGNKKLSVHHLIPFSITKDNNLYNLIALCQSCHMKIEQRCHNKLDMPLRIRNRIK